MIPPTLMVDSPIFRHILDETSPGFSLRQPLSALGTQGHSEESVQWMGFDDMFPYSPSGVMSANDPNSQLT
jgi:hypothetical protein